MNFNITDQLKLLYKELSTKSYNTPTIVGDNQFKVEVQ